MYQKLSDSQCALMMRVTFGVALSRGGYGAAPLLFEKGELNMGFFDIARLVPIQSLRALFAKTK